MGEVGGLFLCFLSLQDYLVGTTDGAGYADGFALGAPVTLDAFHHDHHFIYNNQTMLQTNAYTQSTAVAPADVYLRRLHYFPAPIFCILLLPIITVCNLCLKRKSPPFP